MGLLAHISLDKVGTGYETRNSPYLRDYLLKVPHNFSSCSSTGVHVFKR